jgi:hypothetical protein
MRFFVPAFAALLSTVALGDNDCRSHWTPGADDIAAAETLLKSRVLEIDRFARYYPGLPGFANGRTMRIELVPADARNAAGVHIVDGLACPKSRGRAAAL